MNKAAILFVVVLFAAMGCATPVNRSSPNYVEVGMTAEALKGHRFYFVTGMINVYSGYGTSSQKYGVAIEANADTGKIRRIETMQPQDRETDQFKDSQVTHYFKGRHLFQLDNLIGGISMLDIQAADSWASAVKQAAEFDRSSPGSGNTRVLF
jgi:hypothetical protein